MNKCGERTEKCANDVLQRLSSSIALVASDAIYHGQCESIFFRKKCMPAIKGAETEHTAGHPAHNATKSNFENLYKWHDE